MTIGSKITCAAVLAVALTATVGVLVLRYVIREQGIHLIHKNMRSTLIEAENVRDNISRLARDDAFNMDQLLQEAKQSSDFRKTPLYGTIPVVAAWKAIEKVAKDDNYEFRIPKFHARNPNNEPTAEEAEILKKLDQPGVDDYFEVNEAKGIITYARPIRLTIDCLACHGDPMTSPTHDGKDMLGFPMEGWKVGELHGAFVLKTGMERVDGIVQDGVKKTLMWVVPLAVFIALGFFLLNKGIIERPLRLSVERIDQSSGETALASEEIAKSSQQVAEGASEQAASLEESSASLEELSSMTARNADNAVSAKDLTSQAREAAEEGAEAVKEMNEAMAAIQTSSKDIAKIIKTIDEIALQTNILALNAAVEAARAGDAGMGFAVVADEVRALAQRSALAAKETNEKINDAIQRSNDGEAISGKVEERLAQIVELVHKVDNLITEISTASKEQSQGVGQISVAVNQLDKVTQANAASAEEGAGAAANLKEQSESLKDAVNGLMALVSKKGISERELSFKTKIKSPTAKMLKIVDKRKKSDGFIEE